MSLMGCSIVDPVQDERVCVAMAARSPWMSLDWSLSSRAGLGRTGFRRTGLLPDWSQQLSSRTGHRRNGLKALLPDWSQGLSSRNGLRRTGLPEWSLTDWFQTDWCCGCELGSARAPENRVGGKTTGPALVFSSNQRGESEILQPIVSVEQLGGF